MPVVGFMLVSVVGFMNFAGEETQQRFSYWLGSVDRICVGQNA